MILRRVRCSVALILAISPFSLYAAQPGQYDSAATAVVFNKTTCFIGIVRSGYYVPRGKKHKISFFYLHINKPINVFTSYFHPNNNNFQPARHQYDFRIFIKPFTSLSYKEKFVNKYVQIIGSVIPSPHVMLPAPLPMDMTVHKITIIRPSASYKSVCKLKTKVT